MNEIPLSSVCVELVARSSVCCSELFERSLVACAQRVWQVEMVRVVCGDHARVCLISCGCM